MPNIRIVDTHVHLWDTKRFRYGWLTGIPDLDRNHLLADYFRDCGPVDVAKIVFVQCECLPEQSLEEAEWVSALSHQQPRLCGIVAHASVETGEAVASHLDQLARIPQVKGVRRLIQSEADVEFCLQPKFVRGVQKLAQYGFTFDLCLKHPQLANTIKLVQQCPSVTFILDHIGKPDIKARLREPWQSELRELANLKNVWCKLSGLVTEADHVQWSPADLQPYIDHVIECFGIDRVMFGSDWPVSRLATDYPTWVKTVDDALQGMSADDVRKIYVTNAEAFYRL